MAVVERVISRLFEEKVAAKVSDIGYPRNIPKYIFIYANYNVVKQN